MYSKITNPKTGEPVSIKNRLGKNILRNFLFMLSGGAASQGASAIVDTVECSICLEPINLEKFKLKKNDLVFLECGHVYHKDCLQSWVKSQIKNIDKPKCPMCRTMIVDYCKKDYINYDSDNSVNSDRSYGSEWD